MKAIAAMAENRVIGKDNGIPWHIPEDFKHFKKMTNDGIIVMGRKTVESLPDPNDNGERLPNRPILKLSGNIDPRQIASACKFIEKNQDNIVNPKTVWVCGGAMIYRLLLPFCTELWLTRVKGQPNGDAFMPPFEELFIHKENVLTNHKFSIELWKNRSVIK